MNPIDFVNTNLAGENWRASKLSVPVFVAGYLEETIQSELFRAAVIPLQEKIRHLSFLVHLMVRFDDPEMAHSEFLSVQSDLANGLTRWEDSDYFRAWEGKVWTKIFFQDQQPAVSAVKDDPGDLDFVLENVKALDTLERKEAEEGEEQEEEATVSESDFSCGLCHLKTSSKEELLLHVKTSHQDQEISLTHFTKAIARKAGKRKANINTCDICKVTFSQLKLFEKHKFEFHGETYCRCCDRNYEDFEKYFQHLKHVCVICQKKFKSSDSFACHLRNFHSSRPRKKVKGEEEEEEEDFSCGLCQQRHGSKEELVQHVNSVHSARVSLTTGGILKDDGKEGSPEYTCPLCSKVFYQPKLFERHKWEDHDRKICGCCGKYYSDFEEFYQHLPHTCQYCQKQFKTNDSLGCHIRNYHTDQYKPKPTKPKAGREGTTPYVKTDEGVCPHCGKLYKNLSSHMKSCPLGNQPLPCPHCSYSTTCKGTLDRHIRRIHSQENIRTCPYCGKRSKDLRRHFQNTQCDRPEHERSWESFQCGVCEKQFKRKELLNKHINSVHEKVLNYRCSQCDYKSYSGGNLRLHMKRVHLGKPLKEQCPYCDEMVGNLQWHLNLYHGQQILSK